MFLIAFALSFDEIIAIDLGYFFDLVLLLSLSNWILFYTLMMSFIAFSPFYSSNSRISEMQIGYFYETDLLVNKLLLS